MSNVGRQPLQIVEIDVDFCNLEYGVAPCMASGSAGSECFNTYKTCQDTANFDKGALTLKFSENQITGIKSEIVFPALQSVSTNPTRISLGKTDEELGSLGKRARVRVQLKDFRWGDQLTDPYVATRPYDPATQGTFFGKLRARFPYYYGRALRVRNGYVGDALSAMSTRHYIITEWAGPDSSGNVEITAQDPLRLADDEFAQCPKPSNGRLSSDITESFTGSVDLTPAGVGDEYDASGRIAIGSEILSFTRSGDTLTIVERGLDGSETASHSEDDTVQQCYRASNQASYTVAADLLENFAGVDVAFLPTADWLAEVDEWLPSLRLTRTIAKPTAVRTLLAELSNFGLIFWWDEIDQQIKLKVNRPPGYSETFFRVNDDGHILEKTAAREDRDDQRISQAWYYHGQINAAGSADDPENYRRLSVAVDLEAEGANEYDQTRLLVTFQPWLGTAGDDATANAATNRTLNRYRDTPERVTFTADIKDRDNLSVAALVEVTSRIMQDQFGAARATEMQILSSEEVQPGHRVKVTAETYQFDGKYAFIGPTATPDYGSASDEEKRLVAFIVDESTGEFPDGASPYLIF